VSSKSLTSRTTKRAQCPICPISEATLPRHYTLAKHIASHLEKFALICVPPGSWDNENTHADGSDSSDSDEDTALELSEQHTSKEQEAVAVGHEILPDLKHANPETESTQLPEHMVEEREIDPRKRETTGKERRSIEEMQRGKRQAEARPMPVEYPGAVPVPESRQLDRTGELGTDLANELAEMRLKRRRRSRGSNEYHSRSKYYEHELDRLERERREDEQREAWKREESRIKSEMEIKRLKDEARRAIDDEGYDADQIRMVGNHERKVEENLSADETGFVENGVREKVERKRTEAKEREEREWKEFEHRRKEKEEKEEKEAKEKKEAQETLDDAMRKRLAGLGLPQSQIDAIMDKEKKKREPTSKAPTTISSMRDPRTPHIPVYAKIHIDYIATETLRFFDIPWEYARVSTIGSLY
jgi:hypothetical protein